MTDEATRYRDALTIDDVNTFDDFQEFFSTGTGFLRAKWSENPESEELLKEFGVTIRCIPYEQSETVGTCILTGAKATLDAIFAKAY